MDAWVNEAASGRKYISTKFKPKQQPAPQQAAQQNAEDFEEF